MSESGEMDVSATVLELTSIKKGEPSSVLVSSSGCRKCMSVSVCVCVYVWFCMCVCVCVCVRVSQNT